MRFMVMHRSSKSEEAGIPPTPAFIGEMGRLIGDAQKSGVFVVGEGLQASKARVRLFASGGRITVTRGPFATSSQLVAGFALMKAKSMEEAIGWAQRIMAILGDGEAEMGPVCEPWDLGMMPRPEGELPIRFVLLHKATADSEAGRERPTKVTNDLKALVDEMKLKGVLTVAEGLEPSSKATRVGYAAGQRSRAIDGPFAESKELVAGFSVFQVRSRDEIHKWVDRFGSLFDEVEVDIRQILEP